MASPASVLHVASLKPSPPSAAWSTACHPEQSLVAVASERMIRFYSLKSHHLLGTAEGYHKKSVRTVAWKPNVKNEFVIASGSFDSSIAIWKKPRARQTDGFDDELDDRMDEDEDEWRLDVVFDEHESEIKGIAWNAGGNLMASCSRDKSVLVWEEMDDGNFETIAVLQEHEGDVKGVLWHPEEDLLASCSYDNDILLYREVMDDWETVATLKAHTDTVWALDFGTVSSENEEGSYCLASASADGSIRTWRKGQASKPVETSSTGMPSILRTVDHVEVWNECAKPMTEHEGPIYSISWSKTSGLLVSGGHDGRIIVCRGRSVATGPAPPQEVNSIANMDTKHPDLRSDPSNTEVRLQWDVIAEISQAHGDFPVNHVTWAKDWRNVESQDEIIVSCGQDGSVKIWSMRKIATP